MNVIEELRELSNKTTKGFDVKKLDRVFDTVLLPTLKARAVKLKSNKIRLTDNLYCPKAKRLMKELFNDKFTIQSLIETEMKSYLEDKGFKVITWSPKYSVEVAW